MKTSSRLPVWALVLVVVALLAGCSQTAAPAATKAPAAAATTAPAATTAASGARPHGEGLIKGGLDGETKKLNGAGATFPAVLYSKWFSDYARLTGVEVNYQSIGSGGGIKGISDTTVDFGASDAAMTDAQLKAAKGGEILHIPAALGAVAVTYNVAGVTKPLKFTPETLADIFLGTITKWNDPKLVADNPDAGLPNANIVVVHRSDGSGTTSIFTDYLSTVSPDWKSRVGTGTSVNWPTGLGEKGNEGVANGVKQNPNSIGYVEVIYAIQQKLGVGLVKNKAGNFAEPTLDNVSAAAAGVAQTIAPDLRASIVNAPGDNTYPISGFTWLLVYQNQNDKAKATALTRMLWWGIHDAQKYSSELGYAPLPKEIVTKAEDKILSITVDGQHAFPGR
jgi:phosphate transport system substrate-binding protein